MVHDMAFTDTYALLFDLPVTFDLEAAMGGASFPYAWNHDYGARIGLLPRSSTATDGTDVQWFDIDPCYFYHPLNAYDLDDGQVVLDAVRYETMFNKNRQGPNEGASRLERWTLDPAAGKVLAATLDDHNQEFPRLNEAYQGRRNRYGYGATFGEPRRGRWSGAQARPRRGDDGRARLRPGSRVARAGVRRRAKARPTRTTAG